MSSPGNNTRSKKSNPVHEGRFRALEDKPLPQRVEEVKRQLQSNFLKYADETYELLQQVPNDAGAVTNVLNGFIGVRDLSNLAIVIPEQQ
jgi:hypothetical protein